MIYENWEGENTGWITRDALVKFAKDTRLNLNEFNSCIDNSKYSQKVLENEKFARKINIDATPSFIIFDDVNKIVYKNNYNKIARCFEKKFDGFKKDNA